MMIIDDLSIDDYNNWLIFIIDDDDNDENNW